MKCSSPRTRLAPSVKSTSLSLAVAAALYMLAEPATAQPAPGDGLTRAQVSVVDPTGVPFSTEMLGKLKAPPGFTVSVFAKDMANARWMQVMPNGDVYVARPRQNDIVLLRDTDKDGVADSQKVVLQNLKLAHGLTMLDNKIYIGADKKVLVTEVQSDGSLSDPKLLLDDLPDGGQHRHRTLAIGPDKMLYISAGSTCNECPDSNPESATMIRSNLDGSARTVYAKGLRNTIGFAWHPRTSLMYGFDQGTDWRGDDQAPEELNQILANKDYGWPYCWGDRQVDMSNQNDPPNTTKLDYCPMTEPAKLTYTAHSSPIGFLFYTGSMFPSEYRNDGFVAMRGSWNRADPSGYKIARVRFDANGAPVAIEDFVTGWLLPPNATPPVTNQPPRPARFGRVAGLAVAADGSLLIAEDENGVIYRVAYTGAR
ncbi:sorbosone dehydrogenase family protein [soil metagenome]